MNTIADHVSACLQEFNSLCNSPAIWTDSAPEKGTQSDVSLLKLQNELSRFKVWSGNIGAHKKGRSSLDHRLRDASNIRDQVLELLEDLRESLKDAKDILTGQTTPWDQELSPAEFSDIDSDDGSFQVNASGPSELLQIFAAIVEDINCLLRLSVSIHNPSPHDRFKKACLTDTSGYEPFDVQHVCNKLPKVPKPIAERLGKAISRRRQYFKYRELHHEKLASGLELDGKDQMQSTVASSLPKNLNLNEPISLEEDVDDASDTGISQTSWATSVANPERRKIPTLPTEAENGPFECPFCFMMISVSSKNQWKKHVFSDLFPYICVELGCPAPDQDFQRRYQWAGHVKRYHWKTWTCKLGCNETFVSIQDMKRHLAQRHSETTELTRPFSLLSMCERTKLENESADCPLCGEKQSSFKQFQRHVGRHQEDLALFALPHLPGGEDDKNEESDSESEADEDMEPEIRDELEQASSYVTRLSDGSVEEATDVSERSIRFAQEGGFAPVAVKEEISDDSVPTFMARRKKNPPPEEIVPHKCHEPGCNKEFKRPRDLNKHKKTHSRPWKCPVPTCKYHTYGWVTEDDMDHHYREKHSETPAFYECMFKPCPYKSKRETNCKEHMEKAHGWDFIRTQKVILSTGRHSTVEPSRTPPDADSEDQSSEQGRDLITQRSIEMIAPIENRESFDLANVDVLHLRHKESSYTFKFPQHDIRDGRLRVSKVRELAAGMTYVPESFIHLVELSCKDTKLLIDGTPIRNYGVSRGDTINVEAPQFRKSGPFSGSMSDEPLLDDGHSTEGNIGLEGKAERDARRAEFSSELRQRAMVESSGDQVLVPETESPTGIKGIRGASGLNQPLANKDKSKLRPPEPFMSCRICDLEGKSIRVSPKQCCENCGTPYGLGYSSINDLFRETDINTNNAGRPTAIPEGPEKKQVSCPGFSVNGYCMDGADCPFIHDPAMIITPDSSSKQRDISKPFKGHRVKLNSKELEVWETLCGLEKELEVRWLPLCRVAIASDDGSIKMRGERVQLIQRMNSDIKRKLRGIEELSQPETKAKRRQVGEKANSLLGRLRIRRTDI